MRKVSKRTLGSEKLDLRLTRDAKRALQAAAATVHRSVSEFVLESALARADEALADRRSFKLSATQWKAFLNALDAPPRPLPRLARLLKKPGFFRGQPGKVIASRRMEKLRPEHPIETFDCGKDELNRYLLR